VLKKEANKHAAEERAHQEQTRKCASHVCSSALAARRLLSIHTTSCAIERIWSFWGCIYNKGHNRLTIELRTGGCTSSHQMAPKPSGRYACSCWRMNRRLGLKQWCHCCASPTPADHVPKTHHRLFQPRHGTNVGTRHNHTTCVEGGGEKPTGRLNS
jgi:hypothetical protein